MLKELARPIRGRKEPSASVTVARHDDKMSNIRPMQVDPDDDQRTREDKEAEKASRNPPPGV